MQLGDSRSGKLAENLTGFGRMLRRAGLPVDSARIALAQQAVSLVDVARKTEVGAALSAVFVNREQDQQVFDDLFEAYFRNPEIAKQLMAQLLPQAKAESQADKRTARAQEALQAPKPATNRPSKGEDQVELDAAMSASDRVRLRNADFNALSASEFKLVERLAREIALRPPLIASRRRHSAIRGDRPNWAKLLQLSARHGGDYIALPMAGRQQQELPLLILVDVSGSMERYARLMLAFLHQATHRSRRKVFAFGTKLTDLADAFTMRNTDSMLLQANRAISDFGGGTKLGLALRELHEHHRHEIIGHRTVVLLITDGLDTGNTQELRFELSWLKQQSRAIVWLNPLLRYDKYQPLAAGAEVLHRYTDHMLAIHNLEHLSTLATSLAELISRVR
jgi:uncharacterized protein